MRNVVGLIVALNFDLLITLTTMALSNQAVKMWIEIGLRNLWLQKA